MRKTIFLVAALVLLLGIPSIVGAKEEELKKATVDWVIGYVAEQIAEIGGEDFKIPEGWNGIYYDANHKIQMSPTTLCRWPISEGTRLSQSVQIRGVAHLPNDEVRYFTGDCDGISIEQVVFEELPPTIQVELWYFWMGKEIPDRINVAVELEGCQEECYWDLDEESWFCDYAGYSCQEVEGYPIPICVDPPLCPIPTP